MKKPGPKETIVSDPLTVQDRRLYDAVRWKKNQVEKLSEGFSLVSDGRSGRLYFRDGDRFIEVYVELAGNSALDVVVELAGLKSWVLLATHSREPVPPDQQRHIRSEMEGWLRNRKIRFSAS